MSLEWYDAFLLAALPYRRSLYKNGGFRRIPPPNQKGYDTALARFFTGIELNLAHRVAEESIRTFYGRGAPSGFLSIWDESYPDLLAHTFDPPPVLFWKGSPPEAPMRSDRPIAIVGTRRPDPIARRATRILVEGLMPGVVVSGFARGIDREAHLAAFATGTPTIAVLASGVEEAGPASNRDLLPCSGLCDPPMTLLSEFPPFQKASKYAFPRRNRIIAGLATHTFVMQAPRRSGALITASYALDEGREVSVFDHRLLLSEGKNEGARDLLEQGAGLVKLGDRLEGRIVELSGPRGQMDLWGSDPGSLTWLGGRYFFQDR